MDIEDEFFNLFAKGTTKSPSKLTKQSSSVGAKECVKLLDANRSQASAILMTSQRLDSHLIRHALIGFDNQTLSYETLSSIYAIRPHEEELRTINDYIKTLAPTTNYEDVLDKPELFLLELSKIPAFEERMYCLVYQNKFREALASIEFRLHNINTVCDELQTNEKIKKILGIILACGNGMNATNKARGDADGFDLSILPNLKDVKSKDNTTNLLQYIVYYYVNKIDDDATKMPMPDPSDFFAVAQVNFDELEKELRRVRNELKDIEQRVESVLKLNEPVKTQQPGRKTPVPTEESSSNPAPCGVVTKEPKRVNAAEDKDVIDEKEPATEKSEGVTEEKTDSNGDKPKEVAQEQPETNPLNEPFKSRITEFLKNAIDECKEQEEVFTKSKAKFQKLVGCYCIKPRSSDTEVTPAYFFSLWGSFTQDFKDAWKREIQKLAKAKLKQLSEKRQQIKYSNTSTSQTVPTDKNKKSIVSALSTSRQNRTADFGGRKRGVAVPGRILSTMNGSGNANGYGEV